MGVTWDKKLGSWSVICNNCGAPEGWNIDDWEYREKQVYWDRYHCKDCRNQMNENKTSKCNRCQKDVFWLKDSAGRWKPFNPDVTDIPKGKLYADGYDKIKTATAPVKGFLIHFETCAK